MQYLDRPRGARKKVALEAALVDLVFSLPYPTQNRNLTVKTISGLTYGCLWVVFSTVVAEQPSPARHDHFTKKLHVVHHEWNRCIAAAGSVTIMIPMDTVKTRLVTQSVASSLKYDGIVNCFTRMLREEGVGSLYNSLTPRLVSVVPMIGVQYLVYEVRVAAAPVCTVCTEEGIGGRGELAIIYLFS